MSESQDQQIAHLWNAEDRSGAIRQMMDFYGLELWRLAFAVMRNKQDTDDVLQEVFVKLLKLPKTYSLRPDSVKAFFYKVTRNAAITEVQKTRRHKRLVVALQTMDIATSAKGADLAPNTEGIRQFAYAKTEAAIAGFKRPETPLIIAERILKLIEFIRTSQLPKLEKDILLAMINNPDLSNNGLATMLGRPLKSIESHKAVARKSLREALTVHGSLEQFQ